MPKILIIENTIINYGDDRGGVDAAIGDITEVTKETAGTLIRAGRALYADKRDDPSKGGLDTATSKMLNAASEMAAAANKKAE